MKKKISALLLAWCIAIGMAVPALAAPDLLEPGPGGVYSLTYSSGIINGNTYIVMAVAGTELSYILSDESTLFVDQETAANGMIRFSFIPKLAVPAVVLVFGAFSGGSNSPALVGVIRPAGQFNDIKGSWAEDSITYMTGRGYMTGVSAAAFAPDAAMTRAMLVTVLYRMDGSPKTADAAGFFDVAAGAWYSDAIGWASRNNIVSGYSAAQFGTDDQVTREQIASILYRYATFKGYDISAKASLDGFLDGLKISIWALDPVAWANAKGILSGVTSTTLAPGDPASRAQVAAMLTRFIKNVAV